MKHWYVLAALGLFGCAGAPVTPADNPQLTQLVQDSQASPEVVASEPSPVPVPDSLNQWLLDGSHSPNRFDVSAQNVPAERFFQSLARQAGQNAVVESGLHQPISIELWDVTLDDTLAALRDQYGLDFRRTSYGFRVSKALLQSRTFRVDYPSLERSGRSELTVNTGRSEQSSQQASTLSTQYQTQFWPDLERALTTLIPKEGGREFTINAQSGLILAKAYGHELDSLEDFLTQIQQRLRQQVIIEARIVEVRLESGFRSGIDWSKLRLQGQNGVLGQLDIVGSNLLGSASNAGMMALGVGDGSFNAVLELLATQGDVQVLSSPRISTLNNQKAVIKVGSDEFFVTNVQQQGNAESNLAPSVSLEAFFSGIALDVTPQISNNGEVLLHVRPTVSEVSERTKNIEINSQAYSLPLAYSQIREADALIRANNNQIVVIGGLIQSSQQDQQSGVPWLANLPWVGRLFRQQEQLTSKSELIILLRPSLTHQDLWDEQIRDSFERMQQPLPGLSGR